MSMSCKRNASLQMVRSAHYLTYNASRPVLRHVSVPAEGAYRSP